MPVTWLRISWMEPSAATPALLTRMSMRPSKKSRAWATGAVTWFPSRMSQGRGMQRRSRSSIAATVSSSIWGDVGPGPGEGLGVSEALPLRRPGDENVLPLRPAQDGGRYQASCACRVAAGPAPPCSAAHFTESTIIS